MRILNTAFLVLLLPLMGGCSHKSAPHGYRQRPDLMKLGALVHSLEYDIREQKELEERISTIVKKMLASSIESKSHLKSFPQNVDKRSVLLNTSSALEHAINTTLDNISNWQTIGYKRATCLFTDGRMYANKRVFTQGSFRQTGGQLDLTIQGVGFFPIELPHGDIGYTRSGSFSISEEGTIVNSYGYPLSGAPTVDPNSTDITVSEDGTFSIKIAGQATPESTQIQIVKFMNPTGLTRMGRSLFQQTVASGEPIEGNPSEDGMGSLLQGFVECSNVRMTEEILRLKMLMAWKKGLDKAALILYDGK